jgi:hypothetical protein
MENHQLLYYIYKKAFFLNLLEMSKMKSNEEIHWHLTLYRVTIRISNAMSQWKQKICDRTILKN